MFCVVKQVYVMASSTTGHVQALLYCLQIHCAVLPWNYVTSSDTQYTCNESSESFFHKDDTTVEAITSQGGKEPEPFWGKLFWRRSEISAYLEYYKTDIEEMLLNFNNNYDDLASAILKALGSEQVRLCCECLDNHICCLILLLHVYSIQHGTIFLSPR